MLSISRLNDQSLIITTPEGVQITVTLKDARRGRARVGITAPKDFRIDRAEVLETGVRHQANGDSFGNR